jgi:hypothetical protein
VAKTLVSGEEFRPSCAESLKSRGQSLRADFSISEIYVRECPETGCVSAETGSNPRKVGAVQRRRQNSGANQAAAAWSDARSIRTTSRCAMSNGRGIACGRARNRSGQPSRRVGILFAMSGPLGSREHRSSRANPETRACAWTPQRQTLARPSPQRYCLGAAAAGAPREALAA